MLPPAVCRRLAYRVRSQPLYRVDGHAPPPIESRKIFNLSILTMSGIFDRRTDGQQQCTTLACTFGHPVCGLVIKTSRRIGILSYGIARTSRATVQLPLLGARFDGRLLHRLATGLAWDVCVHPLAFPVPASVALAIGLHTGRPASILIDERTCSC